MNVTGWVWLQHSIEDRLLILEEVAENNAKRWAKKKGPLNGLQNLILLSLYHFWW